MISKTEAIRIVEEYLKLPFYQINDVKIPIYNSKIKRIGVFLLDIYGKIRNRKYSEDAVIEPDNWKVISDKIVILSDGVSEGETYWVIWYNSELYDRTNDLMHLCLGIGPIIIDKMNGNCYETGGDDDIDKLIEDFAKFKKGKEYFIDWETRRIQ